MSVNHFDFPDWVPVKRLSGRHGLFGNPAVVLCGLVAVALVGMVSCGRKDGAPVVEVEPAAPWDSVWAETRGGGGLSGRVCAAVPEGPEVEWTYQAGSAITSEAAVAEGVIVFGCEDGGVHAVEASGGRRRWVVKTGDTVEAAPAIGSGMVFVGSNDEVFRALDLKDGRVLWSHEGDDKFPTGAVFSADGRFVLVNGYDGVTRCWAAADGSEAWQRDTRDYINGSPLLVDGGRVVFGGCDARLHVLRVDDGEAVTGYEASAHITRSLAGWGGTVYGVNHANEVFAVPVDGAEALWVHQDADSAPCTPAALDEEGVFVGFLDRTLRALDRKDGRLLWSFKAGGRPGGAPLVFDDAVVFGAKDGRLHALEKTGGAERWRLDLGEPLEVPVASAGGRLVVGGGGGTLFVVRGKRKPARRRPPGPGALGSRRASGGGPSAVRFEFGWI